MGRRSGWLLQGLIGVRWAVPKHRSHTISYLPTRAGQKLKNCTRKCQPALYHFILPPTAAACLEEQHLTETKLRAAFEFFDRDATGRITQSDVVQVRAGRGAYMRLCQPLPIHCLPTHKLCAACLALHLITHGCLPAPPLASCWPPALPLHPTVPQFTPLLPSLPPLRC